MVGVEGFDEVVCDLGCVERVNLSVGFVAGIP